MTTKKQEVTFVVDNSGDGAIYVNGKHVYEGHECESTFQIEAILDSLGIDHEELEVDEDTHNDKYVCESYPDKLKDVKLA